MGAHGGDAQPRYGPILRGEGSAGRWGSSNRARGDLSRRSVVVPFASSPSPPPSPARGESGRQSRPRTGYGGRVRARGRPGGDNRHNTQPPSKGIEEVPVISRHPDSEGVRRGMPVLKSGQGANIFRLESRRRYERNAGGAPRA